MSTEAENNSSQYEPSDGNDEQILSFVLGGEEYGVDILR
ncbi:MAG: chemotaxis protein CheW, partial [Thiotrichales bacterium]|nr:chemotaxis protein CheW [Thiotrichales bacterium]